MKGIILAAGDGTRLSPLTKLYPKPIIPVGGRPLIIYTIEAFAQAGITDLVIVTGYRAWQIEKCLGDGKRYGVRIQYVFNPHYKRGNAASLSAAHPWVGDQDFLLAMADHLVSPAIIAALQDFPKGCHALGVDHKAKAPPQINDATRVWVNRKGLITRIGKDVRPWNGIDTGVFRLTPRVFPAIEAVDDGRNELSISKTMSHLILSGDPLYACDVSGAFWLDVDTYQDLQYAADQVARRQNHER